MSLFTTYTRRCQGLFGVLPIVWILAGAVFCRSGTRGGSGMDGRGAANLPLVLIRDVDLPGGSTRFDYQDTDTALGRLVIAHMNDDSVLFVSLADGATIRQLGGIPPPRGIAVADDVGLVFATSLPNTLVLIDSQSMSERARVTTGDSPDGVAWDPADKVVGVSDQGSGSLSLIPNEGRGIRTQVDLGKETGNVIFDGTRGWFWITVVADTAPDRLVGVDPTSGLVKTTIELPGCKGAHGLRLHPDGRSAFVACESNSVLLRVDLASAQLVGSSPTGQIPDVMAIDPDLGWLYVAAENGDLTVFDLRQPGITMVGHDRPGNESHTVSVDPKTHRVFFPLASGPKGTPILRIMRPGGT
jgi:DNA-binding beta-propeller fold protein YncE